FMTSAFSQIGAIVLGALSGLWLCRDAGSPPVGHLPFPVSRRAGLAALAICAALMVLLPFVAAATGNNALSLFDAFYRAGALVFGGGHVVLPLLQAETVATGWVSNEAFLSGYGLAQA